jgi:hypothetical protein
MSQAEHDVFEALMLQQTRQCTAQRISSQQDCWQEWQNKLSSFKAQCAKLQQVALSLSLTIAFLFLFCSLWTSMIYAPTEAPLVQQRVDQLGLEVQYLVFPAVAGSFIMCDASMSSGLLLMTSRRRSSSMSNLVCTK